MNSEMDRNALMREGMRIKSRMARPLDGDWILRRAKWDCHYPDVEGSPFEKIILEGPRHPTNSELRAATESTFVGAVRRPSSGHGRETVITLEPNPHTHDTT